MSEPRAYRYLLCFLAVLIGVSFFLPWREADWWLYGKLVGVAPPTLTHRLVIIDVPNEQSDEIFRARVGELLKTLSRQPGGAPWIVMIDIVFGKDSAGHESVVDGLKALRGAGSKLYAAVDPIDNGSVDPNYAERLNGAIYSVMDGVGHTVFGTRGESAAYPPRLSLGGGHPALPALVWTVATHHLEVGRAPPEESIVLVMGPSQEFQARTYLFSERGFLHHGVASTLPDMRNQVVLIGSLKKDMSSVAHRTGPELIAWALNRYLGNSAQTQGGILLAHPGLLLSLLALAVTLAVGVAGLLFKLAPSTHSHLWLLPVAGCVSAVLLIGAIVAASIALKHTMPQITLILLSVITAAGLTGLYLHRYQTWQDNAAEPEAVASEYDVFISYSRTPANARWVDLNVAQPLAKVVKPNGSPLRVFRDTDRIRVGDPWFRRIVHALNASRCFVPIYSDDYFLKTPCVKEMERAAQKEFTSENFLILPISRMIHGDLMKLDAYKIYDKYQYVDANATPDFIGLVAQRILQA